MTITNSKPSIESLAEDVYRYGLQQVTSHETRYNFTQKEDSDFHVGVNRFMIANEGRPITTNLEAVVRPNATTLYASGFLDLQDEPVVVEMPEVNDLTFEMDELSPVTQFWSVPIYDEQGYSVDNELDRYSVNSSLVDEGELHVEDDELVVHVPHEKPADPDEAKNWLPAPEGGFNFTARFYGPKWSLIDGSYDMPRVVPVEG